VAISSGESDVELSSGLKEMLVELEGIYQCTRIQTGTISLVDCNALAMGIEASDEHSAIAKSQLSKSYMVKEAFVFMVKTPEEVAKMFEE